MFLKDKIKIIPRTIIKDNRGWFLKVIDGKEDLLPKYTGEIYLTNAKAGQSKGGHYHLNASEWFTLIAGSCELFLFDIETKEEMKLSLTHDEAKTIFVPKKVAHLFVNTSTLDYVLLAYTDLLYDPKDTVIFEFKNI